MIDHRSTRLPECGLTETSAPVPCFFFKFSSIFSWITILCNNRNRGYQFQYNLIRTATAIFKKYHNRSKNRNCGFLKTHNQSITNIYTQPVATNLFLLNIGNKNINCLGTYIFLGNIKLQLLVIQEKQWKKLHFQDNFTIWFV